MFKMLNINKNFIGLFLISLAALMLEISMIRFFSIAQWYHFAFMVISIALFGIAASGTFLFIKINKNKRFLEEKSKVYPSKFNNFLFISSILFSLSTIIGFLVTNNLFFDPFKAAANSWHLFVLILYYIFLSLPYFFFGLIAASIFSKYPRQSGTIYFYNMSGSAFGVLLAIPFLNLLNVKIILLISFIGLLASMFFTYANKNFYLALLLILINIFSFALNTNINISPYKELNQALSVPNSELILTKYNFFSRVDIVNSSFTRYAPGLSSKFRGNLPEQVGLLIDGSNMNSITMNTSLDFVDFLPTSIPYHLRDKPKVLVINAGAGLDVLIGIKNNATVTALESNPIVIELLKTRFKDYSGGIYDKAEVYLEEGRSFVKKGRKYDIIILSLAGNVLGGLSGVTSLSENYLLTVDAFKDYYDALSEEGIIVVTRWLSNPPKEELRLFSLALEIDKDAKKIAMFNSWTTFTMVLSKKDLDKNTARKIKDFTEKNRFDIIYLPLGFNFEPNKYAKFNEAYHYNAIQQLLMNKNQFHKDYLFEISPVYDDRPYYFNFFKLSKLFELKRILGQRWNPFLDPGFLLFFILAQALILSILFIFVPLLFKTKVRAIENKKSLVYFFAIGIGFLFVEIVFIQKFILFLGHTAFSTSTVIFSMLLFSSSGSLYSQRINAKNLRNIIFILFLLVILYSFILNIFVNKLIILNLMPRVILTSIFVSPLAFMMGFAFPLGMRLIDKKLVPWAWAVNGSASVLSPILAISLALFLGYNFVLIFAGIIYFIGVLFIKK